MGGRRHGGKRHGLRETCRGMSHGGKAGYAWAYLLTWHVLDLAIDKKVKISVVQHLIEIQMKPGSKLSVNHLLFL